MNSLKDVSQTFRQDLTNLYDVNETDSLFRMAIEEVTGFSSSKIKAFPELELSESQVKAIQKILTELKTGKPIQYILGHTEFYGLTFKVNPSVLIPRPETEELVEWIISSVGIKRLAVGSLLDIGTGSGCIAISLKKHLPHFTVYAVDISAQALEIASENASLNDVEIEFIQTDILNLPPKSPILGKKKVIVSNPPYVTVKDKIEMHQNVTEFEPHTALFVPENDPLIFYKAIIDFARESLEVGGWLFFEINENYGEQIVELLNHNLFNNIVIRKDLSGKDRMIRAIR
ncbi:MAG TPA: peptide chain release factor N(5)-glutamine methyltransferase [Mucilaginibacter sp.]|nr:peptide chain release factor N(5)-glutamine methyltransferase [Mucilaginibacter sp.]